jgi:tRNA (cmo5U34)-methyltransferase
MHFGLLAAAHRLVARAGGTAKRPSPSARCRVGASAGVDPSALMLEITTARVEERGLSEGVSLQLGYVPLERSTAMGILLHLPGEKMCASSPHSCTLETRRVLDPAWNHYVYLSQPLLVAAWSSSDEIDTKLGKILQGADPPASQQAVMDLLNTAGFVHPQRFFCSLFWGARSARLSS